MSSFCQKEPAHERAARGSPCNACQVRTLHEPLVRYRMHGSNWSQHNEISPGPLPEAPPRPGPEDGLFQDRCRAWGMEFDPEEARRRSVWYLQCQMAAAKLSSPSEASISPMRVLGRAVRAVFRSPYSLKKRAIIMIWFILCGSPHA